MRLIRTTENSIQAPPISQSELGMTDLICMAIGIQLGQRTFSPPRTTSQVVPRNKQYSQYAYSSELFIQHIELSEQIL